MGIKKSICSSHQKQWKATQTRKAHIIQLYTTQVLTSNTV